MNTPNQSAFPLSVEHGLTSEASIGLTKREYFAGLAMQGIIANASSSQESQSIYTVNNGWLHPGEIAKASIQIADELLKQLEEK